MPNLDTLKSLTRKEKDMIVQSWKKIKEDLQTNAERAIHNTGSFLVDQDVMKNTLKEYKDICMNKLDLKKNVDVCCKEVMETVCSAVDNLKNTEDFIATVVNSDAINKARQLSHEEFIGFPGHLL